VIAALFVEKGGVYYGRDDVDPWDQERDARNYPGPHPVVAHPPCKRWGRYWSGGPSAKVKRLKGNDRGCFDRALWAVRTFGGVIEHPEASHAFTWHGLPKPPKGGGWIRRLGCDGWACCVEQGHYGHPARKATWLYYEGESEPPPLRWGKAEGKIRLDAGAHDSSERDNYKGKRTTSVQNLGTPPAFAELLIEIAKGARQ